MKSNKSIRETRNLLYQINNAIGGINVELIQNAEMEMLDFEKRAELGDAFVWALQEGILNNVSVDSLIKKYKEHAHE